MRPFVHALPLLALVVVGCTATIPDDRFACRTQTDCPPGFSCQAGFCRVGGGDAGTPVGLDAPGFDAPGFDAPGLDALGLDAPRPDAPGLDAPCLPRTCTSAGATCGLLDDLCGDTEDCGSCGPRERCVANLCEACPVPFTTVSCSGDGECGADQVCAAGVCLDACGEDGTAVRSEVASLRGAVPVMRLCTYVSLGFGRTVERDGCETREIYVAIATGPTETVSQIFVQRYSLDAPSEAEPVADFSIDHPMGSYPLLSSKMVVSPSGRYLLTGWSRADTGELVAIDLDTGMVARAPAPGLSDAVWLTDDAVLAITQHAAGGPSVHWMPRPGESGVVTQVVRGFPPLNSGLERVAEPGALGMLLVGGRPASGPAQLHWVDETTFLDASFLPTGVVTSTLGVTGVLPVQRVGDSLVSASPAGGAIERRSFTTAPFALTARQDVFIGGTGIFGRIDDRHIIIPLAMSGLVARLE